MHDHSLVLHDLGAQTGRVTRRDTALVCLVALLWGVNFVVIDWGMEGVPPLLFLAIRFCVVVFPAVLLVPRPDASWAVLARIGALMSLGQFGFLYASLHAGMPAGLAALVLQAQVLLTIAIAAAVLREVPTVRQVVGVALGTLGLAVVVGATVGGPGEGGTPLLAVGLCLAAATSWAAGNVAARASGVRGGLSLTVWSALVVPVPAVALALLLDGPAAVVAGLGAFGWQAAVSTLYTAVLASLVGYGIFNSLLGRYAAGQVVPWILLVPPVGIGSAWLLLGERPEPAELLGGLALLLGALVALVPVRLPGRGSARRTAVDDAVAAGAAGLGVAGALAGEGGEGSPDAARGERRAAGVDLLERAEGQSGDLPLLAHDARQQRPGVVDPAVEDQGDGVVPAAPRR